MKYPFLVLIALLFVTATSCTKEGYSTDQEIYDSSLEKTLDQSDTQSMAKTNLESPAEPQ